MFDKIKYPHDMYLNKDLLYIKGEKEMSRPSVMPSVEIVPSPYKPKNIILPLRKSDDELFLRELLNAILDGDVELDMTEIAYIKHLNGLLESL